MGKDIAQVLRRNLLAALRPAEGWPKDQAAALKAANLALRNGGIAPGTATRLLDGETNVGIKTVAEAARAAKVPFVRLFDGYAPPMGLDVPVHTVESTGLPATERAAQMPVAAAAGRKSLGEVVGHSCRNKVWDPPATADAATFQTKVAAAKLGATAITAPACSEGGFSLFKNCWQSFQCTAQALE